MASQGQQGLERDDHDLDALRSLSLLGNAVKDAFIAFGENGGAGQPAPKVRVSGKSRIYVPRDTKHVTQRGTRGRPSRKQKRKVVKSTGARFAGEKPTVSGSKCTNHPIIARGPGEPRLPWTSQPWASCEIAN